MRYLPTNTISLTHKTRREQVGVECGVKDKFKKDKMRKDVNKLKPN